jgi:hypothetical protein
MSQRRFINFGADANASKIKETHQQFFSRQVLRADPPFFQALAPDQLVLSPHSVIFENGVVLIEDELTQFTIPTTAPSANYTLAYEHEDVDIVGGVAATLTLKGGLLSEVDNGVVLGWVKYPGGSVALDDAMLYANAIGQVQPGQHVLESVRLPSNSLLAVKSPDCTVAPLTGSLGVVVPASPYQVSLTDLIPSRLLGSDGAVRVYNHTDAVQMTRVVGAPALGEFSLAATDIMTFSSADEGKVVDIVDMTYGADLVVTKNASASLPGIVDVIYSFEVQGVPYHSIYVEYVPIVGYTVDCVEVLDAVGQSATFAVSKSEPLTPDGSVARLTIRLLVGVFVGTMGETIKVRLRRVLTALGHGVELRARASIIDAPF